MTNSELNRINSLIRKMGGEICHLADLESVGTLVCVVTTGPHYVRVHDLQYKSDRRDVMSFLDRIEYSINAGKNLYSTN